MNLLKVLPLDSRPLVRDISREMLSLKDRFKDHTYRLTMFDFNTIQTIRYHLNSYILEDE